jgi:hypothetical protein
MKAAKSAASEDRKKYAAVAGFVLVAAAVLYFELSGGSVPATPQPTATETSSDNPPQTNNATAAPGTAAKMLGTTSAALDPTLHMNAMLVTESVEYSGSGRNIFSADSAPVVTIPTPVTSARPKPGEMTTAAKPCPPDCPPPPPPPPPPPIDLKFFGVLTDPTGTPQAFLLHDDTVFRAGTGDIVMRRYRVVSIAEKSIQVEDLQYKDTQALPLLTN